MNIVRLLIEIFILYMLYKLIFDFIIPVYRTTKKMKEKMEENRKNMEQAPLKEPNASRVQEGDYIDFEEIK